MVDAVTTSAAAGRITGGTKALASNFETFLTLLTTQMKNQDPLSPMDSNQFTAQLTQMAGVEQQLLTNDLLTSLLRLKLLQKTKMVKKRLSRHRLVNQV